MNTVDITVIQKPVSIHFECPECEEEVNINYSDFKADLGEPCDWKYSKIECPECKKEIEIDGVDWS